MNKTTGGKMKGVMGIIERDGKFLFGVEMKDTSYKGKWRLLGGKLEGKESSKQAMARECLEEAGVRVSVGKIFANVWIEMQNITIDLCHCKFLSGELKPKADEIGKLGWFSLEEARKLDKDSVSQLALSLYEDTLER
jgi:8-oxo-dGTP pyrophosphatase MutT (NUDIX family)